jgi:1-acyl-sn-glycerol-3-phosphate acyltransferase
MLARLSKWILTALGWEIHADFPEAKKYVIVAAPHTSNWDFPIAIMAVKAVKLDVHWIGKHTIFRWPFGWFLRALGGTPVNRGQSLNLIQQMTDLFGQSEELIFALAPEGTRSKTDHWKTGFYHIARAARVPIALGYLDFGKKQVGVNRSFYPGDDIKEDFKLIREYYKDIRGKNPENESLIQMRTSIMKD